MPDVSSVVARALQTRWLVRAPIWLMRHRLGVLMGPRVLLLEHRGRTSGKQRYVVLERVDQDGDALVVASGFGARAQWYRNPRANGLAFVSHGFRYRVPARVELLDRAESDAALVRYGTEHPRAWQVLHDATATAAGEAESDIRLVRLHLDAH